MQPPEQEEGEQQAGIDGGVHQEGSRRPEAVAEAAADEGPERLADAPIRCVEQPQLRVASSSLRFGGVVGASWHTQSEKDTTWRGGRESTHAVFSIDFGALWNGSDYVD